jgi:sulfur carrier protein
VKEGALKIVVNGQDRSFPAPASLLSILKEMGLEEKRGIAAAVNGAVVPRSEWPRAELAPRDQVLVIRATQGG